MYLQITNIFLFVIEILIETRILKQFRNQKVS